MAVGGAVGAFNAWSNDLKDTYDLTQSHGRSFKLKDMIVLVP